MGGAIEPDGASALPQPRATALALDRSGQQAAHPGEAGEVQRHRVTGHLPEGGHDDPDEGEVEPVQLREWQRLPGGRKPDGHRNAATLPSAAAMVRRRRPDRRAMTATAARAVAASSPTITGRSFQSKRHTWSLEVSQAKRAGGSPTSVGSTFTPPPGWSSHRQMVPVTTNESAKGKRNSPRKKPSPPARPVHGTVAG